MRLPYGFLKTISDKTGISVQELSDYAATRKRPGRERALVLQDASGVDAAVWIFAESHEIKNALLSQGEAA